MDITTTQGMKQALTDKLRLGFGVTPEEADDAQVMRAAALVLRDVMMPGMDGITAMTRLRQSRNLPVILLTAKSEDTDKVLG